MNCYSLKSSILILLVAVLFWSSTMQTCNARRGKHWRQNRITSVSLYKKSKSHSNNHNHHSSSSHGSKKKAPPPPSKGTMPPTQAPSPPPPPTKGIMPPKQTPSPPLPPPSNGTVPPTPAPAPTPDGSAPTKQAPTPPPPAKENNGSHSATFNVLDFGARGDGNTDDTKARRAKPWRQNRITSVSLCKKSKSHSNSHNHHSSSSHGSKKKAPPPPPIKGTMPPTQAPSPPPSMGIMPPKQAPSPPPSNGTVPPAPAPTPPLPAKENNGSPSATFNVLDFGATGDGNTDDTKAFQAAWAAACKVQASTIMVPSQFIFLVGPISFSGPYCESNIVFQMDGTIIAPTYARAWGSGLLHWLEFSKLRGITVQGKGIIDGRGSVWWQNSPLDDPIDDETRLITPKANNTADENFPISSKITGKMPGAKPTVLRFYGSSNVIVTGITIQNSPQCHLKFDSCISVQVFNVEISSPGDSPNTDGIHLQNSRDVLIHNANLACGDDCVSIQTGCSNVYIHDVNCGPGHGISVGGLGKDNTKACVSNITVRDVVMNNTTNGVRIKTWQGGSGSVQNVLFSNIQVSEVQLPIVINQYYCDKRACKNQTSAVALAGITYEKIRGTYTVKPVHLACSESLPCVHLTLTNIVLKPLQERYHLYDPFCWEAYGTLGTPTTPPIDCLQMGKPSRSRIQSDADSC